MTTVTSRKCKKSVLRGRKRGVGKVSRKKRRVMRGGRPWVPNFIKKRQAKRKRTKRSKKAEKRIAIQEEREHEQNAAKKMLTMSLNSLKRNMENIQKMDKKNVTRNEFRTRKQAVKQIKMYMRQIHDYSCIKLDDIDSKTQELCDVIATLLKIVRKFSKIRNTKTLER